MKARDNLFIHSQLDQLEALSSSTSNSLSSTFEIEPQISGSIRSLVDCEIESEMMEERKQTTSLIDEVEHRRQEIESSLGLVGLMEAGIERVSSTQRGEIDAVFDQIEKDIKERRVVLMKEFDQKIKIKLDRLAQQRKQLERDLECLENSVSVSRSIIKNATDYQLIAHLPLITDQLNRLKEDRRFNRPPVETDELDFVHTFDDLSRWINSFGMVVDSKRARVIVGRQGSDESEFKFPYGVTTDTECNIIVCDFNNHRLQMFDREGRFIRTIGSGGWEEGCFNKPEGVAFDHLHQRLIVCDTFNNRIQIFTANDWNLFCTFGSLGDGDGQFTRPEGVAVDQDGRIFVSDTLNDRIQIFDDQGHHILTFGSHGSSDYNFNHPVGICVDLLGRILVCDSENDRLQIFSDKGQHLGSIGGRGEQNGLFRGLEGVAIDSNNNIIVCDTFNDRIQIFDQDGSHLKSITCSLADGHLDCPHSLSVDRFDNLIVSDSVNHRLQIFSSW